MTDDIKAPSLGENLRAAWAAFKEHRRLFAIAISVFLFVGILFTHRNQGAGTAQQSDLSDQGAASSAAPGSTPTPDQDHAAVDENAPIDAGNAGSIADFKRNTEMQLQYLNMNALCIKGTLESLPLTMSRKEMLDVTTAKCLNYAQSAQQLNPMPNSPTPEALERELVTDAIHDTFG